MTSSPATDTPISKPRLNLLPALTSLEISIDYNVADAFLEMLRSRMLPTTPGLERLCSLFNDSTNIESPVEGDDDDQEGAFPLDVQPSGVVVPATEVRQRPPRLENIRIRPTEELPERVYTGLAEIASFGVEIKVEDLT